MKNSFLTRVRNKISRALHSPPKTLGEGVAAVKKHPGKTLGWIDLIGFAAEDLSPADKQLVQAHKLSRDGVIMAFLEELDAKLAPELSKMASELNEKNAGRICGDVVRELVRLKTIIQCRDTHATGGYFADAEGVMLWQWENVIFPIIKDDDFSKVLEIAPGHGRNTEQLRKLAKEIFLVDVNASCIEACRLRFGNELDGCKFHYHVTDGKSLSMILDSSVTFVYSFDSMVHFDKLVVEDYVREIARVLLPGGKAFLHHSNLGAISPNSDWAHNIGTRSDMSAMLMKNYADSCGLDLTFQRLSGIADGWGMDDLDCFSVLQRPNR